MATNTLTLINSTVNGNSADQAGGAWGGGAWTLTNSHIDGNTSDSGAGGVIFASGTFTMDDSSTVSHNNFAGIMHLGAGGEMILTGGTVSDNWWGIYKLNTAVMTVNDTAVTDNYLVGVYNTQVAAGVSTMILNRVMVSGNGDNGIENRSTMILTNSTVSGNTGHGIINSQYCRTGKYSDPVCIDALVLLSTSNTVTGNTGSGISSFGYRYPTDSVGRVELRNTIVAGNDAVDCAFPTTIFSFGNNLNGDGTCNLSLANDDLPGRDPLLGPLQDNGGPTPTHALLSGSPAINAGTCFDLNGFPLTTDQRGIPRPQGAGGNCDIGAYEFAGAGVPVVTLTGPSSAEDGATESYSFTTADPGGALFTLVDQNCGSNGGDPSVPLFDPDTGAGSFDCTFSNGPNTSDVSVQVADSYTVNSNIETITVNITVPVTNFPPVVFLSGPSDANAGETRSYSFITVDPGEDDFTRVSQNCGSEGVISNDSFTPATGEGSFDCTFSNGPNTSDVSVQVADSYTVNSNIETITVTIANFAPVVTLSGPSDANEGETRSYSFITVDPDGDTFTLLIRTCGLTGVLSAPVFVDTTGEGSFDCTFSDGPNTSHVRVQVADSHLAPSTVDAIPVTINNVAPTVEPVDVPTVPVNADDQPITVSAEFSDPAGADDQTYTCTVDYGDGSGAPDGAVAGTSCTADHTYAAPGIYTVTITVKDKDGGTGSATSTMSIVIYDPAAGFVTGGGWIDSPAGADFANLEASGKATFGFVAKYKKDATTPSGNTQFQFKAGRLNFHVDSYQWLVVADGLARFKGTGTIKGEGSFDFLITVTDGALEGGGADKFRLQIIGRYDNGAGQELGKGSIAVHTKS